MLYKLFPKNSKRRKVAKKIAQKTRFIPEPQDYSEWVAEQKDSIELFKNVKLNKNLLISIVVPAYNTPKRYFYSLIYSVVGQTYNNWELIIVDASTNKKSKKLIADCKNIDSRIKVYEKENEGISANTNFGISKAKGEFIAFMDHDDTLSLDALYEIANAINKHPSAELIYSDEDKLSEDGKKYLKPHMKPDWSPDLLTHVNYITHLTVIKKSLIEEVGGLDPKKDGAQDYDLILKVTDLTQNIIHIPKVLYHWREAQGSTALNISNKTYIKNAGELALADHYKRKGIRAKVNAIVDKPGFYKTKIQTKEKTTLVIPIFANRTLVEKYLKILQKKQILPSTRIVIPKELKGVLKAKTEIAEGNGVHFVASALNKSTGYVLFLNDFVIPQESDWADYITGVLDQQHVHAVGPLIVRQDDCIEDAGIVRNKFQKTMLFKGYPLGENTFFGDTDWSRNVDELTGAIMAVRRDKLKDFINHGKYDTTTVREILNRFSAESGEEFNVVSSTTPMKHVRSAQQHGRSRFMNPGLEQEGSDLSFYPNDKQIMDVLKKISEEVSESA